MQNQLVDERPSRGLSAAALKTIAIVAMVIDHIAWAFVPTYSALGIAMHFVGRITGPTMFYFIAEGYHHTRNKNRYTLRMAVFAVLSYLPFFYFQNGTLPTAGHFAPVGVIYTLFFGVLALRVVHEIKALPLQIASLIPIFLLSTIGDWSYTALLYILCFDAFRGNWPRQFAAGTVVILLTILPSFTLGGSNHWQYMLLQSGQFLPLLLLGLYNGQRGRGGAVGKWFFYLFYPAHLLALGLLKAWYYGR